MEKTPNGGKSLPEETSAYRSYKKRQEQKPNPSFNKASEALDRFSSAIDLLSRNKMNRANAFENRIIDFIENIFEEFEKEGSIENVWQRYTTGIDACGKIYGYCVDSIHSDVLGILQGLNRDGANQEVDQEDLKQDKKKKKKFMGVKTLVEKEEEITTNKFDRFEEFDMYFKTVSSKFDASNYKGLLLNNVSVSSNLDLVFASDQPGESNLEYENISITYPKIVFDENAEDLTQIYQKFKPAPLDDNFNLDLISSFQASENKLQPSNKLDYFNDSNSDETGAFDSNDDMDLAFTGRSSLHEENFYEGISETLALKIQKISESDEYKFFNKPSSWAGFDYASGIVCASAKISEKKQKKKREKTEDNFSLNYENKFNLNDLMPKGRTKKPVVEKFLAKTCLNKLPANYRFTLKRFTRFFTRPNVFIKNIKGKDNVVRHKVFEKDRETSSDDEQLQIDDYDELDKPDDTEQIKFTVKSKQVDIKKLKETMAEKIDGHKSFLQILDDLPGSVPKSELDQLSIHSCFITMLHLANENNLQLEKTGPCDFSISKKAAAGLVMDNN